MGGWLTRDAILSSWAANIAGDWILRGLGIGLGLVVGVCRICCIVLYGVTLWVTLQMSLGVTLKISLWVTKLIVLRMTLEACSGCKVLIDGGVLILLDILRRGAWI